MAIDIHNPPDAKPERISRLVTRIEQGDIKIPKFQRGFIWRQPQVLELLDSIYRGFPIGSLLFWLTERKLADERDIGGFDLPATPDKYPRNYTLDGQQRLTTIYGALRAPTKPGIPVNVKFDLESEELLPDDGARTESQVPMNILFNTPKFRQFQQGLLMQPNSDALVEKSDRLHETFREYSIPVVTVTEADIEQVSPIFERINSTGTKLTVFDLMVAATWSEDFDLNDHVSEILQELEEKDFGELDRVTVLRALSTCVLGSAKRESILGLRKLDRDELTKQMERTKEAVRRATDFLTTEVCIMSDAFLPYERQLVVLAYVMSQMPHLDATQADTLQRWFWRTSFSERYRRGGEGLFDTDLEVTVAALSNPDKLTHFGREVDADQFITTEFRKTSAFSNAFVALLASRTPKNLTNGATIDVGTALSAYNRKEFHHIFPQAYLKSRGISRQRINSIANICMLSSEQNKAISDKEPAGYFAQVKDRLGDNLEAVLASNLIPSAAVPLIEKNDYDGFLQTRASHLAEIVKPVI
jgi:hypothetical protein